MSTGLNNGHVIGPIGNGYNPNQYDIFTDTNTRDQDECNSEVT